MPRTDVEFPAANGTILRGWLHLPDGAATGARRSPGVVMAHGFSATRHMGLAPFAEVFCDAGLAVLVYDHRNLGDSDGEPRQEINPWAQARDYGHALDWLAARDEVDGRRMAVWGTSYSGGGALVAGAMDDRVRAVVANVPFACIPGADYDDAAAVDGRLAAMRAALEDRSGTGPADGTGEAFGPMAVVDPAGGPAFLPQEEAARWFTELGGRPGSGWVNRFTMRSVAGPPAFDPGAALLRLSPKALLVVVATEERLADLDATVAVFERAGEPKKLVTLEGDHFAPYHEPAFGPASAAMREFLLEHL